MSIFVYYFLIIHYISHVVVSQTLSLINCQYGKSNANYDIYPPEVVRFYKNYFILGSVFEYMELWHTFSSSPKLILKLPGLFDAEFYQPKDSNSIYLYLSYANKIDIYHLSQLSEYDIEKVSQLDITSTDISIDYYHAILFTVGCDNNEKCLNFERALYDLKDPRNPTLISRYQESADINFDSKTYIARSSSIGNGMACWSPEIRPFIICADINDFEKPLTYTIVRGAILRAISIYPDFLFATQAIRGDGGQTKDTAKGFIFDSKRTKLLGRITESDENYLWILGYLRLGDYMMIFDNKKYPLLVDIRNLTSPVALDHAPDVTSIKPSLDNSHQIGHNGTHILIGDRQNKRFVLCEFSVPDYILKHEFIDAKLYGAFLNPLRINSSSSLEIEMSELEHQLNPTVFLAYDIGYETKLYPIKYKVTDEISNYLTFHLNNQELKPGSIEWTKDDLMNGKVVIKRNPNLSNRLNINITFSITAYNNRFGEISGQVRLSILSYASVTAVPEFLIPLVICLVVSYLFIMIVFYVRRKYKIFSFSSRKYKVNSREPFKNNSRQILELEDSENPTITQLSIDMKIQIPAFMKMEPSDFIIGKKISEGGGGIVKEGQLANENFSLRLKSKDVIIKIIKETNELTGETLRTAFLQEVAITAHFSNHPHCVKLIGFIAIDHMIIFKRYKMSLHHWIVDSTPSLNKGYESIKKIMQDLSNAVAFMHSREFAHNDIKPSNVLLDYDFHHVFRGILTDFGLATTTTERDEIKEYRRANPGGLSLQYAAPEVITRATVAKKGLIPGNELKAGDVYAYGMTLLHTLQGKSPWSGLDTPDIIARVLSGDRPDIQKLGDRGMPWSVLTDIVKECWKTSFEDRPTMESILEILEDTDETKLNNSEFQSRL